jgi:hypothetical protein
VKRFKPIVKYKNEIFGKELHEWAVTFDGARW